jgi:hypothetical protein
MKKTPTVGSFKLGDEVSFRYDESTVMSGIIVDITKLHVIIKPTRNNRYYDGFRVTLSRNDVIRNTVDMKHYIDIKSNDDGSFTI